MSAKRQAVDALRLRCSRDVCDFLIDLPEGVPIYVKSDEGADDFVPVAATPHCEAAVYAESHHLILALDPHRADRLVGLTCFPIVERNSTTVRVRVHPGSCYDDPVLRGHVLEAVEEALLRSASRPARSRPDTRRSSASENLKTCPQCMLTLPASGRCDEHG